MNILLKTAVVMAATIALIPSISHATSADYVVISRSGAQLNDANDGRAVFTFTLPTTVLRTGGTANSAALVLEVLQSEFNFHEMYINPLGGVNETCDDDANDGNEAQSIGRIREHDDANAKTEYFTSVKTFTNSKLLSGTNTLLICARDINGDNLSNIDDITVQHIMLHYKKQ
jgi:hypothetical protein